MDGETYPVDPDLALRVWWGSVEQPTPERWAFAISAKKDWRQKVRSDVDGIMSLEEGFTKIFFMSNQFIRAKARKDLAKQFSDKYPGIEVVLLDRNWIVEKIIGHKREGIAIKYLNITSPTIERRRLGPNDTWRKEALDELEKKLGDLANYGSDYELVEDYLMAGEIARELELPQRQTDAFFFQARRVSKERMILEQHIRCLYQHARTSIIWYRDPDFAFVCYEEMEPFLDDVEETEIVELYSHLNNFLLNGWGQKKPEKFLRIHKRLDTLSQNTSRPVNALRAKTLFYFNIYLGFHMKADIKVVSIIKKCIKEGAKQGIYPLLKYSELITTIGNMAPDYHGIEELFDLICRIVKERKGETEEGKLLFERGVALLSRPSKALHFLGRARVKLMKEETLKDGIHASFGCFELYESMGLLWAARTEGLLGAHFCLKKVSALFEHPLEAFLFSLSMARCELRLGRIAPFLAWYEYTHYIYEQCNLDNQPIQNKYDDIVSLDSFFSVFILNISDSEFTSLQVLDGVAKIMLPHSHLTILYRQGEKEKAVEPFNLPVEEADIFFEKWKNQPVADQLPKSLQGQFDDFSEFSTIIMGVGYVFRVRNDTVAMFIAENMLGIIEITLALAKWEDLAFIVDEVKFQIDINDSGTYCPRFPIHKREPSGYYQLLWKPDSLEWMNRNREEVVKYFHIVLLGILT